MNTKRFENKVAIVTGASRGIGQGIALAFAREGAHVVSVDIGDQTETGNKARALGAKFNCYTEDFGKLNQKAAADLIAKIIADTGRVDILVNNAAMLADVGWQPFDQWTVEEWDQMLDVNLRGMWFCARAFVPLMKARAHGKIVNVTSSTFWEGVGGFIHYTSSKAGVIGFTRALGRELGECGIRVNALAPGYTMTDAQVAHAAAHPEHPVAMRARRALAGRDEAAEDLAGPAFFLASEDSDFMTCQTILVDGGGSMW